MVERERFVPRRISRLTDELCDADVGWGAGGGPDDFRAFGAMVSALFHHRFHSREQALSDAWELVGEGDQEAVDLISSELTAILDDANYARVTVDELDEALQEESLIRLRFDIDLDDYDELLIARRGTHRETVELPRWKGLRTVEHTMSVDEDVVVHTRVKPAEWFAQTGVDPADRNLEPDQVSLKQFQHVPRADIEMLLPSIQVRYRPIDTLVVGVPAMASGIAVLTTKLAPTIGLIVLLVSAWLGFRDQAPELDQTALVVLLGGLLTLGGFVVRQWTKLKNRRVEYLKTLSENLYFRTLGDGPGVIHTLLASAEQQEVAEVLLAYRFLVSAPDGLHVGELDRCVEEWLAGDGLDVDFEVDDAVEKLIELDLVDRSDDDRLRPLALAEALARLDQRWDDLFDFAARR